METPSIPLRPILNRPVIAALAMLICAGLTGCVERTLKIRTDPAGALVSVNDEEVGLSPVKFSFLWYGDYDIIVRKPGYETLKTHHRIDPPWYQLPPIDLVAETLTPAMIKDERETPLLKLTPAPGASVQDVLQRATELRGRALYEGQ